MQGPVLVGVEYLADDHNCGGWLGGYPWGCSIRDYNAQPRAREIVAYMNENADAQPPPKILVVRAGGYGDIIMLTPTLREIKRRWPNCKVGFSVSAQCIDLVRGLKNIDEIHQYPCPMDEVNRYDFVVSVGNLLEFDPRRSTTHAIDIFADAFGLTLTDRECSLDLTETELSTIAARFPRDERPRIGIQLYATAAVRTYPRIMAVVAELQRNNDVWLFTEPGTPDLKLSRVRCTHMQTPPLAFRESCALLATCDSFIGPDSSMTHAAGALGIRTVALYASFDWRLRTAYAKSIHALTGHAPCAPCFHHPRLENMPEKGECMTTLNAEGDPLGFCTALFRIEPARICAKAQDFAHEARRGRKNL